MKISHKFYTACSCLGLMSYAFAQTPAPDAAAKPDQAPANAQTPDAAAKPGKAPANAQTPATAAKPGQAPASAESAASSNPDATKGNELRLAPDAPDRYTVVKGDTLWDISAKFLQQPWRWAEIWSLNKDQVSDPHWIYPGQVLFLIMTADGPRLISGTQISGSNTSTSGTQPNSSGGSDSASGGAGITSSGRGLASGPATMAPKIYASPADQAIPSIPQRVIDPFLTRQLVLDHTGVGNFAGRVVGGSESRFMSSAGDMIYVVGLADAGKNWDVYRSGRILTDPDGGAVLGQEADYLGSAVLLNRGENGEPSVLRVTKSQVEISANDYVLPATQVDVLHYVPHAVPKDMVARVVSIAGGAEAGAQMSVIAINRGKAAGVEVGHVFALYRTTPDVENFYQDKRERIAMKDQRYGLVFVFRVLDSVSYALIMKANWPVTRGDRLLAP